GLGHMFGFRFLENFNYPYISKSITEFWRRWHISLSSWFRDYVYIPLGGNRVSHGRHILNLMIVWLLTGFWHGASWNYVAWGVYYGGLLIIEKYVLGKYIEKLPHAVQHVYCMFFVMIGWELFAFGDLSKSLSYMAALFGGSQAGFFNSETIYLFYNNVILLAVLIIGSTNLPKRIGRAFCICFENRDVVIILARCLFYAAIFLLSVAWLVDASYNPFLYFRF
ncbi:MAG: MBOAT family protein, partial [Lachnospiraceae bacterium]|nr:MBOAT family protein [Lachnospiraceae bacterium]